MKNSIEYKSVCKIFQPNNLVVFNFSKDEQKANLFESDLPWYVLDSSLMLLSYRSHQRYYLPPQQNLQNFVIAQERNLQKISFSVIYLPPLGNPSAISHTHSLSIRLRS